MANKRMDRKFEEAEAALDGGLSKVGKRNARNAERIHDEIEATTEVMRAFLKRQLPALDPEHWRENYVQPAVEEQAATSIYYRAPEHSDIEDYDFRNLALVLQHCLPQLTFERGSALSAGEIRNIVNIRNAYEHRGRDLNTRDWQRDVESIKVFRAKLQTDQELAAEEYDENELATMEADVANYLRILEDLQRRMEGVGEEMLGLAELSRKSAANDARQDEELERQQERDKLHEAYIERNMRNISGLKQRDKLHDRLLAGVAGVSVASLAVSVFTLLRK